MSQRRKWCPPDVIRPFVRDEHGAVRFLAHPRYPGCIEENLWAYRGGGSDVDCFQAFQLLGWRLSEYHKMVPRRHARRVSALARRQGFADAGGCKDKGKWRARALGWRPERQIATHWAESPDTIRVLGPLVITPWCRHPPSPRLFALRAKRAAVLAREEQKRWRREMDAFNEELAPELRMLEAQQAELAAAVERMKTDGGYARLQAEMVEAAKQIRDEITGGGT